jgi:hypothetical protein
VQIGLSEIAAQLGVLTAEPSDRLVGLAALTGANGELGPELLDRSADIKVERLLRVGRLIEAQQDRSDLGQQHQRR